MKKIKKAEFIVESILELHKESPCGVSKSFIESKLKEYTDEYTDEFRNLTNFNDVYFKFLNRMAVIAHSAEVGNQHEFAKLINDNEKVARIVRPKYGEKLKPLMRMNGQLIKKYKIAFS